METETKRIDLKSLLLGALVGASVLLSAAAVTSSDNTATWEYKILVGNNGMRATDLQEGINKAAADGWTLASTSSYSEGMPLAVMKRVKK